MTEDGKRRRERKQFPTRAEADSALDARKEELKRPKPIQQIEAKTFGEVIERYEQHKSAKKSIAEDKRILKHLKAWFGADRPIQSVTPDLIDQYDAERGSKLSERTKGKVGAASRNRDLAVLRTMLRLAHRWGYIEKLPEIRLHKEPERRIRWLESDEETRLLDACRKSKTSTSPA